MFGIPFASPDKLARVAINIEKIFTKRDVDYPSVTILSHEVTLSDFTAFQGLQTHNLRRNTVSPTRPLRVQPNLPRRHFLFVSCSLPNNNFQPCFVIYRTQLLIQTSTSKNLDAETHPYVRDELKIHFLVVFICKLCVGINAWQTCHKFPNLRRIVCKLKPLRHYNCRLDFLISSLFSSLLFSSLLFSSLLFSSLLFSSLLFSSLLFSSLLFSSLLFSFLLFSSLLFSVSSL